MGDSSFNWEQFENNTSNGDDFNNEIEVNTSKNEVRINEKDSVSNRNIDVSDDIPSLSKDKLEKYDEVINHSVSAEIVLPQKLKLLGFYNFAGQSMYPETIEFEKAHFLAKDLELSFYNIQLLDRIEETKSFYSAFSTAVLIFRDEKKHLYAYFPKEKIARITNVKYSKKGITVVADILKCWFVPGKSFISTLINEQTKKERKQKQQRFKNPFEDDFGVKYNIDKTLLIRAPKDIVNYDMADSTEEINSYAFSDCGNLESINIPVGVLIINTHAFSKCSSLKSIVLPGNLEIIDDDAFYYCSSLQEITIPPKVNTIGRFAFCGCGNLKSIILPEALTYLGSTVFAECTSLESITLPNKIESINSCSFDNCKALKRIQLPDSLTYIGEKAFQNCTSLKEIKFPPQLHEIDTRAFRYCSSLETITFTNIIYAIGERAFVGCNLLRKIYIPKGTRKNFEKLLPKNLSFLLEEI